MPKIAVSKTVKAGVGRYESTDIMASIELEVPDAKASTIDAAFKHAYGIVDAQLNAQLAELSGILKPDSVWLPDEPKTQKGKR